MKKLIATLLIFTLLIFCVCSFVACKENEESDENITSITIAVPDGGPALGMAYLMKEFPNEIDGVKVTYKIVDGSTGIRAAVLSGEADMAIMPTNMAAILYNGGLDIRLVGTNSYGLLYLLSDAVSLENFSLDSLKGQVLHTVGQGGTPEVVLKKILESAGIEYEERDTAVQNKVALNFHEDGKTIIAGLKQGKIHYALLGEPAVSTAIQNVGGNLSIVYDLQEGWKSATDTDSSYPQTSLVAKQSLIKANVSLVKKIAKLTVEGSIAMEHDAMPCIEELRSREATVPATFGAEGVARLHIDPHFGSVAKAHVTAYFEILLTFKPQLIGGKLPNDAFYCDYDDMETISSIGKAFLG